MLPTVAKLCFKSQSPKNTSPLFVAIRADTSGMKRIDYHVFADRHDKVDFAPNNCGFAAIGLLIIVAILAGTFMYFKSHETPRLPNVVKQKAPSMSGVVSPEKVSQGTAAETYYPDHALPKSGRRQ